MSFLGLVLNLKKTICKMYQLVKIHQAGCFATLGSSACQGSLSWWHVQLSHPLKQVLKLKCQTEIYSNIYRNIN